MSLSDAIGRIMSVAERINALCDAKGLDTTNPTRERMHRWHGEMLARGSCEKDEIVRVIASALAASPGAAGA